MTRDRLARRETTSERAAVVDAIERLAFSLVALTSAAMAEDAHGIEPTFRQWRLLVVLGESPDGYRLAEIAERIGGSAPSSSRLVRRLEARRLVRISRDPEDRRGIRVVLSSEGRAMRSAVIGARRRLISQTLGELPLSPGFADQLRGLADALGALTAPAAVDTLPGPA